jgi:hypothetical protein
MIVCGGRRAQKIKSGEVNGDTPTTRYVSRLSTNPNAAELYFMLRKGLSTKL